MVGNNALHEGEQRHRSRETTTYTEGEQQSRQRGTMTYTDGNNGIDGGEQQLK
jgi:hypothetical protein